MATALRVGIFGGGIVGGGTAELIQACTASGKLAQLGARIEIAKICVRSLEKARDFTLSPNTKLVTSYDDILKDPSINCVVEVMGGVTHAKDVVFGAINAGKHVVTANKALIAAYLPELQTALKANPTVSFNYEAAVCGGIPIIHTLQTDYACDRITKVMGIMNGTTNFMLCKMEDEGADYGVALAEGACVRGVVTESHVFLPLLHLSLPPSISHQTTAQALGFAEADPTADVEGHDVQAKAALMAKLAFGRTVPWETVPTAGISKLTSTDFEYARILKSTIKLVGVATLNPDGSLAVFVSPMVVPLTSPLASAKGPGNMVVVTSQNMPGSATYAGPGAGRFPTANSICSDLVRLSQGRTVPPFPTDCPDLALNNDYEAQFYVRISITDGLGIIRQVGEAAEQAGVSIHAILQNPISSAQVDFVVTTEKGTKLSQVKDFSDRVSKTKFALRAPLFMPML